MCIVREFVMNTQHQSMCSLLSLILFNRKTYVKDTFEIGM